MKNPPPLSATPVEDDPLKSPTTLTRQRRYLAVHFPKLSSERIFRQRHGNQWRHKTRDLPTLPLVFTEKLNNAFRLVHVDERAESLGLSTGMSLADARAAYPQIEVLEADRQNDALLLEAIADWCDRYTPLVAIDKSLPNSGHYGLTLDITGCAHLFGGERALMQDLLARLFHQGFTVHSAIAPTPGAAWALSRYPQKNTNHTGSESILSPADIPSALMPLPLAALRLGAESINALARLGLRTIGQLKIRPRGPLARRFGREPLLRLDQALGEVEEAISPRRALPVAMAERRFAEPLVLESDIEATTLRLAGHLAEQLEKRGEGVRQMELCLYRIDGKTFRLDAGTSRPERTPETLTRLFRERFAALSDEFDAGYGFETVRLSALVSAPFEQVETGFLEGAGTSARLSAQDLIDRLAARLGSQSILRGWAENTHLPEMAESVHPVHAAENAKSREPQKPSAALSANQLPGPLPRPLRLFEKPEPVEAVAEVPEGPPIRFRWRRVLHKVVRVEGPERIADHWWAKQNPRLTRDYFRIEDEAGRRYWLFREGLYTRETDAPRWFLHGQFA